MTEELNKPNDTKCDDTCPCRAPNCEESCPEWQFQERFSRWLAVQYSDLPVGAHQNIVLNASAIFDDLCASYPAVSEHRYELPACEPDKPYGIPAHPAAKVCTECHARKCCVIWDCPLRNEIVQAAREDEREKVLDKLQEYIISTEITLPSDQSEDSNEFVYSGELQQKIESLRSTTEPEKDGA